MTSASSSSVLAEENDFATSPGAAPTGGGILGGEITQDDKPMLVEADELIYDYDRNVVVARGSVQIYYGPYTLEAKQVTYDRDTSRVLAEGDVRVTEPGGNVIYAESADLTDTFGDGFVKALRVETPEKTRFAAESAERFEGGERTEFNKGVYTACEPCKKNPNRPPLWQVKATRIIHNKTKQLVTYHGARLEFFGVPIAYIPVFWHPDPTVKRKSGFLTPKANYSDKRGFGFGIPYFWAVRPNADVTFAPMVYSRQGVLGVAEWRHRLINGAYTIQAAGINQANPVVFAGTTGNTNWRGAINTEGRFDINKWWRWGWNITGTTDTMMLRDYPAWRPDYDSTVYLSGQSLKNNFDARL
ncbi:MAG: LPS-assembly protein LptD, partial [Hyphomicrobiales bacterium]|nr:LPS-assembly protein LptD [Hyphomicrobiales bacterium]